MQPEKFFDNLELCGLSVTMSEFAVPASDGADRAAHEQVSVMPRRIREQLQMDIAFVAEFVEERRVFRYVDARTDSDVPIEPGHSDPLEDTYCQRIVDGRLPLAIPDTSLLSEANDLEVTHTVDIGAYLSAPVLLRDGRATVHCVASTALQCPPWGSWRYKHCARLPR